MAQDGVSFEQIGIALKRAAAALRAADIRFLVAGSLASWARGGPETRHDLDLIVHPRDAERALEALVAEGMRPERPPEGWLFKARDHEVVIDLIFGPKGLEVTDELLARGQPLDVLSMRVPVMSLEDLLTTKLLAITEHSLDFSGPLRIARALREQIDWAEVRAATGRSPFAHAFFVLLEDLEVIGTSDAG